jgi:hypothetical protein
LGAASYATRVLYQQTLFFLLPFYLRSTTLTSANVAFTGGLAALAALACLDLTFDRWLRRSPAFAATFFFAVGYAALQLLLPLALRVPFGRSQSLALAFAFVAAASSLGIPGGPGPLRMLRGAAPAAALLALLLAVPRLVPPAPLRLAHLVLEESGENLRATAHVAAPVSVPVDVTMRWERGSELLRASREIAITAHEGGFRVWDELARARLAAAPETSDVRIELQTGSGQLLGRRALHSWRKLTGTPRRSFP